MNGVIIMYHFNQITKNMNIREGERILKIFYPHVTPFIFYILKAMLGVVPLFLFLFVFSFVFSSAWYFFIHIVLILLFGVIVGYMSLIYWLDRLVITNRRIVHIDWKNLTSRNESEALIADIQDVQTEEKGILSYFRSFDYGTIRMDTASSYTTIEFKNAPDPEGIRRYIYKIRNQ
jgi:hypothetical protein